MKHFYFFLFINFFTFFSIKAQSKDTIITKSGLKYYFIKKGNGKTVDSNSVASLHFTMWLSNGKKYDSTRDLNKPYPYKVNSLIKGMREALLMMKVGDRGVFIIPYHLAYGEKGIDDIPPKETIIFDMEVVNVYKGFLREELMKVLFDDSFKTDSLPKTEETIFKYKQLKKKRFSDFYTSQYELNAIGYKLIKKFPKEALKVFKLNVHEYPQEANPYDSLGECYMKLEENELAIKNFKKALEIDPKKANSLKLLKKLTGK